MKKILFALCILFTLNACSQTTQQEINKEIAKEERYFVIEDSLHRELVYVREKDKETIFLKMDSIYNTNPEFYRVLNLKGVSTVKGKKYFREVTFTKKQ